MKQMVWVFVMMGLFIVGWLLGVRLLWGQTPDLVRQVTLAWNPVNGADGYQVNVSEDGSAVRPLERVTTTSYVHRKLTTGTTYCYSVQATLGTALGDASTHVCTEPIKPEQVTGLTLKDESLPAGGAPPGPYPILGRSGWHVVVSSELSGAEATKALDGLLGTHWRTATGTQTQLYTVLLGTGVWWVDGAVLSPRPDSIGVPVQGSLAVSLDGQLWQEILHNVQITQELHWPPVQARYVQLRLEPGRDGFVALSEININGIQQ